MQQKIFHWLRRLSIRERLLALAFVWVILLVWLFAVLGDFGPEIRHFKRTGQNLAAQERKLAQAEQAQLDYEHAITDIEPERTLNASQLFGKIDAMARDNALQDFVINRAPTESSELFNFYRVRLNIDRASLPDLMAFDEKLKAESPYLTLTGFTLRAIPKDPRTLDATFEIASFQLKSEALQSSN
ncbi:MAG: hypothetical protein Q7P63_16195 [Verrucomicrobiota bacterium JB022]|nr:hypothetical protein [Verrucomicrobiota bacterium JB022]